MTCPNSVNWELLSMELGGEEAAALIAHTRVCEKCRDALAQARRDHLRLMRAFEVFDADHDARREQLMAAVPVELPRRARPSRLIRLAGGLGDLTMKWNCSYRRAAALLAPAACLLIVAVVLVTLARGDTALAKVIERIRQAHTMTCRISTETTMQTNDQSKNTEGSGKLEMYSEGATRAWLFSNADPPESRLVLPDRIVMTDADGRQRIATVRNPQGNATDDGLINGPEVWLDRLLSLSEEPDRELGIHITGGQKVRGFEIAGWKLGYGARPAPGGARPGGRTATVTLWVSVVTRLPVRMEVDDVVCRDNAASFSIRTRHVWDAMQWDVALDPQAFEAPPATADVAEQIDIAAPTEQALIDGLKVYAADSARVQELMKVFESRAAETNDREMPTVLAQLRKLMCADSAYPEHLDAQWLSQALAGRVGGMVAAERLRAKYPSEATEEESEAGGADASGIESAVPAAGADLMKAVMPITFFYEKLVLEGREPEYFGATVGPGDAGAVLLRWRLDDGRVRVVHGDLSAETTGP